ncbi:MAG: PilZ domain-containing protein [Planctomycetota bacterium]
MGFAQNQIATPKESIQLSKSAWNSIVEKLNEHGSRALAKAAPNRDIQDRTRYTIVNRCVIRLKRQGNPASVLQVRTRNLSQGGLAFFGGNYIFPDTPCHVALVDLEGNGQLIAGTVKWCRHIDGNLHECGVEFDERINVEAFLNPESTPTD